MITLRFVNVGIAVAVVLLGSPQWRRWWATYTPEVLQGRLALAALVFTCGYGSAESLYLGTPAGPRTVVTTVGLVWAFYTVAWQPAARLTERIRTCRRSTASPTMQRPRTLPRPPRLPTPRASNRR